MIVVLDLLHQVIIQLPAAGNEVVPARLGLFQTRYEEVVAEVLQDQQWIQRLAGRWIIAFAFKHQIRPGRLQRIEAAA